MKIIREVSPDELIDALTHGGGTTWTRVSESQKEYTCRGCGQVFFSDGAIFHSLCDDDFADYNLWVMSKRIKHEGYCFSLEEWKADMART